MQYKVAGALIVALLIALPGCGSSGSQGLTRARFTAQVNAVCRQMHAQINALHNDGEPQSMRKGMQQVLSDLDQALSRLDRIKPRSDLQSRYDAFKSGLRVQRGYITNALGAHPRTIPHSIQAASQERTTRIGRELNLTACV